MSLWISQTEAAVLLDVPEAIVAELRKTRHLVPERGAKYFALSVMEWRRRRADRGEGRGAYLMELVAFARREG